MKKVESRQERRLFSTFKKRGNEACRMRKGERYEGDGLYNRCSRLRKKEFSGKIYSILKRIGRSKYAARVEQGSPFDPFLCCPHCNSSLFPFVYTSSYSHFLGKESPKKLLWNVYVFVCVDHHVNMCVSMCGPVSRRDIVIGGMGRWLYTRKYEQVWNGPKT